MIRSTAKRVGALIRAYLGWVSRPAEFGRYVVYEPSPPLLAFSEPNDEALAALRLLLAGMEISKEEDDPGESCQRLECNVDELIENLRRTLEADYDGKVRFTQENPHLAFEYWVLPHHRRTGVICINTRIHSLGRPGGVSYGRRVQRPAENRFLLWCDE